jgi:Ribbon-helix-helix protein, copG family
VNFEDEFDDEDDYPLGQGQHENKTLRAISSSFRSSPHVINGYMQKIQILFPDPIMARLRRLARIQDRPVSEIVRRAVEETLAKSSEPTGAERKVPAFRGGNALFRGKA